ncbi:MAG: asparagine synthase-related protein, partial [Alphaproteobacteria bacterium]
MACEGEWVLGDIFQRGTSDRAHFKSGTTTSASMRPQELMRRYWGHYVAILRDGPATLEIARAPFGRLPCLYTQRDGLILIASDLALLTLAGWIPTGLDWSAIAHRLAFQNIASPTTCLSGVTDLRGGACLRIGDGALTVTQAWTPWDHGGRRHWTDDRDEAADALRRAVTAAVRASRGDAERALLMLSGGLDSSILAATLASQGGAFACFNLSSQGGVGDERSYARAVASHLGASILEAEWDVGLVDFSRSHAVGLPNPVGRSFMQGTNALLAQAIATSGADLSIDGGAGDNVFCALQSVAPVTDALVRGGRLHEAWTVALSIASLAQVGAATVFTQAIKRAFRCSPAYRWHGETQYLASAMVSDQAIIAGHPWLQAPKGAETGTAAHIALIVAAQTWAEASDLHSPVRHASPLATQPVVEACLRVPSWWWFENGRNRVIARKAYAARLPAEIIERRSKGSPDGYIAALYTANRTTIRAMLLDGRLRAAGMLDVPALERALGESGPLRGTAYHRLMRLADVEAWIAGRS